MSIDAAYWRDANRVPITYPYGPIIDKVATMIGSGGATTHVLFTLTGSVYVQAIWGVVETALENHTAAYWRLNDQGAQVDITANAGTSLTNLTAGSVIVKKDLSSAALTKLDNSAGRVSEPTTLETVYFSSFVLTKKTGALTQIEYRYVTSDAPTHGKIHFYIAFLPITADGNVEAA